MARRNLRLNLWLIAVAIGGVVALQVLTGTVPVAPVEAGSGCEGDLGKIEGSSGQFDADSIGSVCIKSGNNVFTFACGETDPTGCYTLDWTEATAGCCTSVTIGRAGSGRNCKTISHTAASSAASCGPQPTPTPDPHP